MVKMLNAYMLVAVIMACSLVNAQKPPKKPNLLFIIVDQLRYDALSIAGNTIVRTPNIDRIGKQGVYFKNAYTPMAVCAPARAAILTGCTVENTGVVNNSLADNPVAGVMPQETYDEILTAKGYRAEYYGKYHSPDFHNRVYKNPELLTVNGKPIFGQGMQVHFRDFLTKNVPKTPLTEGQLVDTYSGRPYTPNPMDKMYQVRSENDLRKGQPDLHGRLEIPDEFSITAMQAKETMEAISRLKDSAFSLTCSFHLPHAPMLPTAKYYQMYPPEKIPVPVSLNDKMDNSPYSKANGKSDNPEYADADKIRFMISDYYGLVKEVDDWVGKILDRLDELKLVDNTMIIFTADHGEMMGSHGLREKNVFYEESAHIPLLIRFPKAIKPNKAVTEYATNRDLFATIFDYLGLPKQPSDGLSLRDLIENKPSARPGYIVTEWHFRNDAEPNFMIVKDGWKMFIPRTAASPVIDVLFNLNADPHEMDNLIGKNTNRHNYQKKVDELKADLLEWLAKNQSKYLAGVAERQIIKD